MTRADPPRRSRPRGVRCLALLVGALALLAGVSAYAEPGMQQSKIPLWKVIDQPFFSLDCVAEGKL